MNHIHIILKAEGGEQSWVLQVATDLKVRELIKSLAIHTELPYGGDGHSYDYNLRQERVNNRTLLRDKSLAENEVLHGDILTLFKFDSPIGGIFDTAVFEDNRNITNPTLTFKFRRSGTGPLPINQGERTNLNYILAQADELQQRGELEAGLKLLLRVWWTEFKLERLPDETADPPLFNRLENNFYHYLGVALDSGTQASDQAYLFLQEPEVIDFFQAYPNLTNRIVQSLLEQNRRFAIKEQFEAAQLAALLAIAIRTDYPQAQTMEWLARSYISWRDNTDPLERWHIARRIFEVDPNYGNIRRDLQRSEDEGLRFSV